MAPEAATSANRFSPSWIRHHQSLNKEISHKFRRQIGRENRKPCSQASRVHHLVEFVPVGVVVEYDIAPIGFLNACRISSVPEVGQKRHPARKKSLADFHYAKPEFKIEKG